MASPSVRFDRHAHEYGAHAHVQRDMAQWLAEWLDPPSDMLALEFGAGSGFFTRLAQVGFPRLIATDCAPRMLALGQAVLPQVSWRLADAWKPPFQAKFCEAILSSSLLQWAPDPCQVLQKWREILRPEGVMLHGFYVSPTLPELSELVDEVHLPLRWRSHVEWEDCFAEAGLEILRCERLTREYHYASSLAFWRDLHRTGTTGRPGMPAPRLRQCLQEYGRRFACNPMGSVRATWTFCRVEAKRL